MAITATVAAVRMNMIAISTTIILFLRSCLLVGINRVNGCLRYKVTASADANDQFSGIILLRRRESKIGKWFRLVGSYSLAQNTGIFCVASATARYVDTMNDTKPKNENAIAYGPSFVASQKPTNR